jgi:DNA-binding response OmpR family regulator
MKIKAIVLDDDDSIRTLTSEILKDRGYDVCASSEPLFSPVYLNEECTCSDEHCSTIVITDINMPRKDGIEVIKYIRSKENSQKNCSIFVISANKSRDVITECLRLGANDYLMKPFQPESVKEKVKASIIKILRANHNNLPENNNNKNITISEINSIKEKYYIANKLSNSEKAIIEDFINNL